MCRRTFPLASRQATTTSRFGWWMMTAWVSSWWCYSPAMRAKKDSSSRSPHVRRRWRSSGFRRFMPNRQPIPALEMARNWFV
eukprot:s694_g29.t1